MRDIFEEIYSSLRRNKLRTCLTGFAVAWGIFMIIVLLGAGNGLLNALLGNNDQSLANTMEVYGNVTTKPYDGLDEGRFMNLNDKDVKTTEGKNFSDVIDDVVGVISQNATITYGEESSSAYIIGVNSSFGEMEKVQLKCGRFLNDIDDKQKRKNIVIPAKLAESFLGSEDNLDRMLGKMVKLDNMMFKVVGVYHEDQSSNFTKCYAPFSTIKIIYNKGEDLDHIIFSFHGLPDEESNEAFENLYKRSLNSNHRAAPTDMSAFYVYNNYTGNIQMHKGIRIIRLALWILGLFTLVSGVVGVSNIMLITVKERTHEFGIRKAIGASPVSILKLIVTESIAITAFFGYVGMIFGLVACEIMNLTIGQKTLTFADMSMRIFQDPFVGVDTAISATVVLIIAGLIAGLLPASRASRIKPIEALREG